MQTCFKMFVSSLQDGELWRLKNGILQLVYESSLSLHRMEKYSDWILIYNSQSVQSYVRVCQCVSWPYSVNVCRDWLLSGRVDTWCPSILGRLPLHWVCPFPIPGPVPVPGLVPVLCLVIFLVFIIGLVTLLVPVLRCHGLQCNLWVPPGSSSMPRLKLRGASGFQVDATP